MNDRARAAHDLPHDHVATHAPTQAWNGRAAQPVNDLLVPTSIGHALPGDRMAIAGRVVATAIRDLQAPAAADHHARGSARDVIRA